MTVQITSVIRHRSGVTVEGTRKGVEFRAVLASDNIGSESINYALAAFVRDVEANDALTPAQMVTAYTDKTISLGDFTVRSVGGK